MTAQEALRLSVSHNLGSPRNTLMPGVAVPAFTGGDPDAWAARVQAIGLSRLAPVGSEASAFTTAQDAVAPMWTGGNNTQVVRKDPQAQETAIQRLISAIRPAMQSSGSFDGSGWVFGNDIGSASAALVAKQNADRQYALSVAAQDLQRAQIAQNNAVMNRRDNLSETIALANLEMARQNQGVASADRLNAQNQADFENQFRLAQFLQGNLDASTASRAGLEAINSQGAAAVSLGTAVSAYNDHAAQIASEFNAKYPGGNGILLEFGADGVARLKPGPNVGAAANDAIAAINGSAQAAAVRKAQQDLVAAEIKQKSIPYLPRASVALPKAPSFNTSQLRTVLSPSAQAALRSGARPLLSPSVAAPVASVAPASQPVFGPTVAFGPPPPPGFTPPSVWPPQTGTVAAAPPTMQTNPWSVAMQNLVPAMSTLSTAPTLGVVRMADALSASTAPLPATQVVVMVNPQRQPVRVPVDKIQAALQAGYLMVQ